MKQSSKQHRRIRFACRLDTILQDCASQTAERVSDNRGRYQMVGMKNEHIVKIINDALSALGELTDDMNIRLRRAGGVEPCLSESNGFEELGFLFFDEKNLQMLDDWMDSFGGYALFQAFGSRGQWYRSLHRLA